jgi:hypothetical protein
MVGGIVDLLANYRKSVFQLEQWSPSLARRIWGLNSFLQAPLTLAPFLRVNRLSDLEVEVEIPSNILTIDDEGNIRASALVAGGEFAARVFWTRHVRPSREKMSLSAIHGRFLKPVAGVVKVRTQISDVERERVLRKIRLGESVEFDMPLLYIDQKNQNIASINYIFNFKPAGSMALGPGKNQKEEMS